MPKVKNKIEYINEMIKLKNADGKKTCCPVVKKLCYKEMDV